LKVSVETVFSNLLLMQVFLQIPAQSRIRVTGNVACNGERRRNVINKFIRKFQAKALLGRPRGRQENNIKIDLK
jgi:hypothetical protein